MRRTVRTTSGTTAWTTWGTTNFYYPPTPNTDALTHGLNMLRAAFVDYYAGTTHESFWGRFGWMDTPLVIRGRLERGQGSLAVTAEHVRAVELGAPVAASRDFR